MQNERPASGRRRLSPLKIVSYLGLAAGALVLVCAVAALLFSDAIANRFVKPRIAQAFVEAYPAYAIRIADMKYSVAQNRIGFDSIALRSVDSTFSGTIGPVSVSGIAWTHLLWGGSLEAGDFATSVLEVQDIVLNFLPSQYELRCKRLHVSVADSTMAADSLAIHPSLGDEQFFEQDKFRKTRFSVAAPQCRVTGVSYLEMLQGTMYRTRSVRIHDVFLDILMTRDKPNPPDTSRLLMPHEILSSMETLLQVDSLSVMDGRIKYGERFMVGATPSLNNV